MTETRFLIATHNTKKRDELQRILAPLGIRAFLGADIGMDLADVEETGQTFEENALLKAESGCRESGLPCIADDSGLVVDALGGAPGVYSARYAGVHGDDDANIVKLLGELEGVPDEKRAARFVCAACCVFPDGRHISARGECEGFIGYEKAGNGGFGYDPVFLPVLPGGAGEEARTMAQLSDEEKDSVSHRGKALKTLTDKLEMTL